MRIGSEPLPAGRPQPVGHQDVAPHDHGFAQGFRATGFFGLGGARSFDRPLGFGNALAPHQQRDVADAPRNALARWVVVGPDQQRPAGRGEFEPRKVETIDRNPRHRDLELIVNESQLDRNPLVRGKRERQHGSRFDLALAIHEGHRELTGHAAIVNAEAARQLSARGGRDEGSVVGLGFVEHRLELDFEIVAVERARAPNHYSSGPACTTEAQLAVAPYGSASFGRGFDQAVVVRSAVVNHDPRPFVQGPAASAHKPQRDAARGPGSSVSHGDVANLAAKTRFALLHASADDQRVGALEEAQARDPEFLDPTTRDEDLQHAAVAPDPNRSEALRCQRCRHHARVFAPGRAVRHFEVKHFARLGQAESKAPETRVLGLTREQATVVEVAGGCYLERNFKGLAGDRLAGVDPHPRTRLPALEEHGASAPHGTSVRVGRLDDAVVAGHVVVDQASPTLVEHPLRYSGEANFAG